MTLHKRVAFVAAVVALGTIFSTAVRAYTVLGYTWAQSSMTYYINPANMDVPTAAIEPAIRTGADAWRVQSGASFAFAFAGFSAQTKNTNDGINLVMFRNASSGSALATTYSWFSGSRLIDADIVFWDAVDFDVQPAVSAARRGRHCGRPLLVSAGRQPSPPADRASHRAVAHDTDTSCKSGADR